MGWGDGDGVHIGNGTLVPGNGEWGIKLYICLKLHIYMIVYLNMCCKSLFLSNHKYWQFSICSSFLQKIFLLISYFYHSHLQKRY